MPASEIELIEKAKKGDRDAFAEIYRIFLSRIYRFIFYLVADESLAEDISQDTFVRAWEYLPRFSTEKGTLQSFLFTIARNLVIDHQRKKKEIFLTLPMEEAIGANDNLEENMLAGESENAVKKALSILSGFEKQIVILRYFEELSYDEIADVSGKAAGAIRVRVHRALKKLREHLETENYE